MTFYQFSNYSLELVLLSILAWFSHVSCPPRPQKTLRFDSFPWKIESFLYQLTEPVDALDFRPLLSLRLKWIVLNYVEVIIKGASELFQEGGQLPSNVFRFT